MEFAGNQGQGLLTYRQETMWRHRAKRATIPAVWPATTKSNPFITELLSHVSARYMKLAASARLQFYTALLTSWTYES
jgi:hypothetical protein